ncbi:MAG: hypothetical protein HDT14_10205 [Oscillibacter sp.]|nr:hypothetical protein [Oscillibacter sp.]
MRRFKRYLLVLVTLLLVATGAAMPFAVSHVQDARQVAAEVRPFDSFQLTLKEEADLSRLLGAIASGAYYINETPDAEDTALTQGLALAAVEDLLTHLVKYDLLMKETLAQFSDPRVRAQTVVPVAYTDTETEGAAAALPGPEYDAFPGDYTEEDGIPTWTVTWNQPSDSYIWLDDATGKAIYIQIPSLSGLGKFDGSNAYYEEAYAVAEKWRAFLSDYYSTEVQVANERWYDDAVRFGLSFPLGVGEDQEIFHLELFLYFSYRFSTLSPYVS